jgi:hypothetical protein
MLGARALGVEAEPYRRGRKLLQRLGSAASIFGIELRRVPLLRLLQRRFHTLHKRLETRAEERGADPL